MSTATSATLVVPPRYCVFCHRTKRILGETVTDGFVSVVKMGTDEGDAAMEKYTASGGSDRTAPLVLVHDEDNEVIRLWAGLDESAAQELRAELIESRSVVAA